MPRHPRVSMILALAMVATLAFAAPASAATEAFHASGPFARATWAYQDGDLTVTTDLLAFRQQGASILIDRQVFLGDELVSDTFGWARGHVLAMPHLASVSIAPTVLTVQTCNGDGTVCGAPWNVDVGAVIWTGVGEATEQPDAFLPWAPPPPFCLSHEEIWVRDATLGSATDPFGGDLGEIGLLEQSLVGDVALTWVSVGGACFPD